MLDLSKKPEIQKMMPVVLNFFRKAFFKIALSFFVFQMLQVLLISVAVSPAALAGDVENLGLVRFSTCVIFLIVALIITNCLFLGLTGICSKTVKNQKTGVVDLFFTFYKRDEYSPKTIFFLALFHTFVFCFSFALVLGCFLFVLKNPELLIDFTTGAELKKVFLAEIFAIACLIIFGLMELPFIFSFNMLLEYPAWSFKKVFFNTINLSKKKIFNFIGFVFNAIKKNLLIYVIIIALVFFVPDETQKQLSFVFTLLSFYSFIQQYAIVSKFFLCISVYFYSTLAVNRCVELSPEQTHVVDFFIGDGENDSGPLGDDN